jgi:MFS family permease
MFAGALGLAASSVLLRDPQLLFLFTSIMLFVFGVGVGGEYPLAACSASEAAMGEMKQELKQALDREEEQQLRRISGAIGPDGLSVIAEEGTSISKNSKAPSQHLQQHRGRQVQLVFTMQGMGIFVNSLSMTVLLLVMGQTTNQYNRESLLLLWRTLYLLGATMLLFVLLTRYRFLKESRVWLDDKRRRLQLARNLFISPAVEPGGALQTKVGNLAEAYAPPSTQIYTNRLSLSQAAASSPPPPATVAPEIPEVRTNRSGFSDISSLSAPSVELLGDDHGEGGICGVIKEVPSTDPQDDLRANDWSLLWRNYGARLLGTSLSWLLWDVAFYGNKLFQSSFLLALTGEETTLLELALAATVNSFVALLGYFSAAAILDHPNVGRCRLQAWGFLLTGCLFVGCGLLYKSLSPTVLVTMYLGSSFFGQLGPNATTFLIPAEIFPTEMRTVCHGISAASGKLGALMAAVAFHHLSDIDMFLVSGYASLAACAISFWWIPETSGLDLYETDRRWRLILDGRRGEYEGEANHIRFLSFYERYKLRVQRRRNDSRAHLDSHFDAGY